MQAAVLCESIGSQDCSAAELFQRAADPATSPIQPGCSISKKPWIFCCQLRAIKAQPSIPPHKPLRGVDRQPAGSQPRSWGGMGCRAPWQWAHCHADAPGRCLVQHRHPEQPLGCQSMMVGGRIGKNSFVCACWQPALCIRGCMHNASQERQNFGGLDQSCYFQAMPWQACFDYRRTACRVSLPGGMCT